MDKMLTRHVHPLLPLSPEEITRTREVITKCHGQTTALSFRSIHLQEPDKADLIPYLVAEHAGTATESTRRPPRLAKVQYNFKTGKLSEYAESTVDVELGKEVKRQIFPPNTPASMSMLVRVCSVIRPLATTNKSEKPRDNGNLGSM